METKIEKIMAEVELEYKIKSFYFLEDTAYFNMVRIDKNGNKLDYFFKCKRAKIKSLSFDVKCEDALDFIDNTVHYEDYDPISSSDFEEVKRLYKEVF